MERHKVIRFSHETAVRMVVSHRRAVIHHPGPGHRRQRASENLDLEPRCLQLDYCWYSGTLLAVTRGGEASDVRLSQELAKSLEIGGHATGKNNGESH